MAVKKPLSIVWTTPALRDLEAVMQYQATHSTAGACAQFLDDLDAILKPVVHFPKMGRQPRDYSPSDVGFKDLRELLIWDYRLAYQVRRGKIEVLYVIHVKRLFPPA